jgi:quinol monooxygenase YgiN
MPHTLRRCAAAFAAFVSLNAAPPAFAEGAEGLRYGEIPKGAYAVVAEIRAKPGKEAELRQATLPLVRQVRNEPHNLLYFLQEDRETPGRFVFYEIFATQAAFEAHNATPHVQAWFARLPELAQGEVKVTRLQILGN